jgi:hypothetical protein
MDVNRRLGLLLAGTVLGTSILVSATAFADDAQLQQQINAMQRQLQAMQDQLAETKRQAKAAAQQAQQTQQAQQQQAQQIQQAQNIPATIPPNLYAADVPVPTKGAPSWFDSIHVSMAGTFVAMEGAWRQRNENSSGATDPPFSTIPLLNSPLYNENEQRFSAQQSRIAFKASGDIDPARHVKAYFEMDFLGAAPTANSRESNSYTPRIRQAYFAYDDDYWHGHFSAGQMWSLATQNRVGILNSTENIPLTIDAQYVVGFNWARQPAIRFVEDWGKIGWFAVAVESSATNFASNGNGVAGAVGIQSANSGTVVPPGIVANVTNNCNASGLLDPITNCSINPTPDIIEKIGLDPGWGHYEALGIQRWFADATAPATGVGAAALGLPGSSWSQRVTFGWGVGGNALLPAWPKYLDLQGSVLYGQGIGRYASSQLADVVVGPTGNLQPLTSIQFMVGAVAHPFAGNDIYVYYGEEHTQANAWTVGSVNGGWGNSAFNESCGLITSGLNNELLSTNGGTGSNYNINSAVCTANVQAVREITAGFWQDIYKGDLGRARVGLQYEFVSLDLFRGLATPNALLGGNPLPNTGLHPNNNIVFLSLRYYPFN